MNTQEKTYITASELAETLGISMGQAYKIIRQLNSELAKDGYITVTECKALLTELIDLMKKSETETTVTTEDVLTEK